jgi:ABC-2 type transport system ATP-binding protein
MGLNRKTEFSVSVVDLTKHYGELTALNGVTFNVPKGSIFGLLGPNGAGKTTTIKILTGLTRPTSGSANILGNDIVRDTIQAKKRIGVVPESSNIYEEMTAEQNLIFAAEMYGVARQERSRRTWELLEIFGLAERGGDMVAGFSRGMKRRLTIACGIVHRPEVLFLDEPTTGLDIQSALVLREQVRKLNAEGTTVLLTTHYLEEADQLCDTVAMINKGRIVALDSPERLKAGVIGSNIVDVSFSESVDEDELCRRCGLIEVHRLGDKLRLTVGGEVDVVGELIDYSRARGVRITSINTLKPSLEDAFLRITGLNPEEAGRDKEPVRMRRQDG